MNTFVIIIATLSLSFIISLSVIPLIIKTANSRGVLTHANHRTSHSIPTPSYGGIAIFAGLIAVLPFLDFNLECIAILAAITIVFIVGLRDDTIEMSSLNKLFFQILCAVILYSVGFKLKNLHGFLGINELGAYTSFLLTIVFIVGVTNSFNLIDGINGLAGSIMFINSLVFGVIFLINGEFNFAFITLSVAASLVSFLRYNFKPAKIFMGDTGSLFLGLLMSIMAIKTIQISTSASFEFPLVVALLFFPVFDTFRLFLLRILHGKSPFTADRNHLHHLLLEISPMHHRSTLIICVLHLCLVASTTLNFFFEATTLLFINIGIIMTFFIAIKILSSILYFKTTG